MEVFMKRFWLLFIVPGLVVVGIISYIFLQHFNYLFAARVVVIVTIAIGSVQLVKDTFTSLIHKQFALDYIAILAITVGIVSGEYIVAAVIVLMMAWGNTLEKYGLAKAKNALTWLADRIPDNVTRVQSDENTLLVKRMSVLVGDRLLVKRGEVISLDGTLLSESASIDESSLTGEPYPHEKSKGGIVTSGTLNVWDPFLMQVTKTEQESTYHKIIQMVQQAQDERSPFIRLADRYSVIFTIITLLIAGVAYFIHGDLQYVLAVLVIATPCPLILATPIALMWGMSSSAKKLIIVKHLSAVESLARIDAIIFDKTGTITLGKPVVTKVEMIRDTYTESQLLAIAGSLENNSLHPLAQAVVNYVHEKKIAFVAVHTVKEVLGKWMFGTYEWKEFHMGKYREWTGMSIGMWEWDTLLAIFSFEDQIKKWSRDIIRLLQKQWLNVSIYTWDHQEAAEKVVAEIWWAITIKADCKPEDKQRGIEEWHQKKKKVAMVGDGINDAPALASADVGMVFSNNEHTATTESADIVFLAWTFHSVLDALMIAKWAVSIAEQSIIFGMWLSTLGMILAAGGLIPPVVGAGVQELIDVIAILNALRASRL